MPAELHYTNGAADFFEVGITRSAWHREGVLLRTARSRLEAERLAHLNYVVEKVPTYMTELRTAPDGGTYPTYVRTKSAFVTRRTDTGVELGAVGAGYQPLQNSDAFRSMDPLLDTGIIRLETGGVLRDGADAWLLARFDMERMGPVCQDVFGDELRAFGLWRTNHSGRRQATISLTDIRGVCANTIGIADARFDTGRDRGVRIVHRGAVEARAVDAARTLFAGIVTRYETIAATYQKLKATALDEALFRQLVINVALQNPRTIRPATANRPRSERYDRRVAELTRLWTQGAGHTGDGSAWEAMNGLVEGLDHDAAHLWPTRTTTPRLQALVDGHLGTIKRAVFDSLVAFASAKTLN